MENDQVKRQEVKQIPIDGSPFEANGKTYYVSGELSIERWIKLQGFQTELGFGVEFEEMQKSWLKLIELANKQRFTDIAVLAHNMVNGVSKVFSREPIILKFCALFFNVEGEDLGIITDEMITSKISDWKAEGLGIDNFFVFSLSRVSGLADAFKSIIQGASELNSEED